MPCARCGLVERHLNTMTILSLLWFDSHRVWAPKAPSDCFVAATPLSRRCTRPHGPSLWPRDDELTMVLTHGHPALLVTHA